MKDKLYEGLISTYPLDYTVRFLQKHFAYCIQAIIPHEKINNFIVYFEETVVKDDIDGFIHFCNTYGWFPAYFQYTTNDRKLTHKYHKTTQEIENIEYGNINFHLIAQFEAKYDVELDIRPKYLFHVTDFKNLEKIKKIGFIPKTKNKQSNHPDRIYFVTDPADATTFVLTFKRMYNSEAVVLITIDTTKIESLKLFKDPNFMSSGVYTLNNISPETIIKIQTYTK